MKILQDFGKYDLIIFSITLIFTIAIFYYAKIQYSNFIEIQEFTQRIHNLKEMR